MNPSQFFAQAWQRNQKSSALKSLLWLAGVVATPSLYLSLQANGWIQVALFGLAALIVVAILLAYAYLVKKDPRLVQSEGFQLEARKLDIVAEKGGPSLDALFVEITQEPKALSKSAPSLPRGSDSE